MTLLEGDREIEIRPKAFDTLLALLRHAGRVVSKDELVAIVWPNVIVNDDALAQCIRDVRKAIADTEQRYIRTISRRGYMFIHEVTTKAEGPNRPGSLRRIEHHLSILPTIAVMPFANLSGDAEQAYFADGIVDELITALSRFKTFASSRAAQALSTRVVLSMRARSPRSSASAICSRAAFADRAAVSG